MTLYTLMFEKKMSQHDLWTTKMMEVSREVSGGPPRGWYNRRIFFFIFSTIWLFHKSKGNHTNPTEIQTGPSFIILFSYFMIRFSSPILWLDSFLPNNIKDLRRTFLSHNYLATRWPSIKGKKLVWYLMFNI